MEANPANAALYITLLEDVNPSISIVVVAKGLGPFSAITSCEKPDKEIGVNWAITANDCINSINVRK
jgi:hypothetical protein